MNFEGILICVISFVIMGVFHPVVIKCEYYFTDRIWPLFLVFGLLCAGLSFLIENTILSASAGVLGCTFLWCIGELKEQAKRVRKGWFPQNPLRRTE